MEAYLYLGDPGSKYRKRLIAVLERLPSPPLSYLGLKRVEKFWGGTVLGNGLRYIKLSKGEEEDLLGLVGFSSSVEEEVSVVKFGTARSRE